MQILGVCVIGFTPVLASAHCDALDGPVVLAARSALESRDVAKVLRWVDAGQETTVREAFDRTIKVRTLGGDAQALADTWFFETLVRLHRTSEGEPFEGLKPPGGIDPLVTALDQTLASGNIEALVARVSDHVTSGIRRRFARVLEARTKADESVERGREFVAAYVEYVHYVEGIHGAAMGSAGHSSEPAIGGHQHAR
jgi:hypothetical protein